MTYEREYMPKKPEEDKVYILNGGRLTEVEVPNDTGKAFDEEDI